MADTTERLPFALSERLASTIGSLASRDGREIHFAIGGIPFRTAITGDTPMSISTAPVQKDQQDTEPEAGEQTLAGWWLRSQASWHEGAGARYAESRGEIKDSSRFWESSNVDVWTPGEMSLLRRAVAYTGTVNLSVAAIPDAATNSVVIGQNGAVRRATNLDSGATLTDLYVNAGVQFTQVIASENYWWAAGNDGKVYSGPIGSSTTSPTVWNLINYTSTTTRILWAKHRLWAVNGHRLYVIDQAVANTNEFYKHPSSGWTYTDLCDAPAGVLFSGHGDGTSGLQKVTLEADGAVPTLSGAQVTAVLPSDEKALRVSSLASSMVCILTNRGVRVAAVDGNGEMVYGPLFMTREELGASATPALCSAGRWWWLCWGDEPKLWRIDSSVEVEDGVFAYASDMEEGLSNFRDVTVRNERPVVTTAAGSIIFRHLTELCDSGYLESGRIRYRTDEPKVFRQIDLTGAPLAGTIAVDVILDNNTSTRLVVHSDQGKAIPTAELSVDVGTQRYISIKLSFTRSATDATSGPELQGIQVKALPATRPQRLISIPLLCYDSEQWSTGQREMYEGWARDRYLAVRAIEDAGGVTTLQDFTFETPIAETVRIEEMKLVRLTQPDMERFGSGFGGILMVVLRTLT